MPQKLKEGILNTPTMTSGLRQFALTAHITSTVGWLGAIAGFLALAIVGLTSQDAQRVRGAYLAMEVTGWYVLVPLCLASLVTGLVMSLGTPWGLFRHYWVLAKFVIAIVATLILFMYTQTLGYLGALAADTASSIEDLRSPSPVLHAGAALLALLVATTLSVYKPRGMTPYGWRKLQPEQRAVSPPYTPGWVKVFGIILIVLVLLVGIRLLAGGHGPGRHAPSGDHRPVTRHEGSREVVDVAKVAGPPAGRWGTGR